MARSSLCSICQLSLAEDKIASHLSILDLARLELTERSQRTHDREHWNGCWLVSALAELQQFVFAGHDCEARARFTPCRSNLLLGKEVTRANLVELVLCLRDVLVPEETTRIRIKDWHQAQGLIAAVRRAKARALTHVAEGGYAARLVVAAIMFSADSASSARDAKSATTSLQLEWLGAVKAVSSVEVALMRRGSQLFPSFPNPLPLTCPSTAYPPRYLTFDIQTVSSVAKLSLPSVRLCQDGSLDNGVGLSTLLGASATITQALVEGVICVFSVRSPSPPLCMSEMSRATSANRGVHALHLDARR